MWTIHHYIKLLEQWGLPHEIACKILYEHRGVCHPIARGLRTDDWLNHTIKFWQGKMLRLNEEIYLDSLLSICSCPNSNQANIFSSSELQRLVKHISRPVFHWQFLRTDSPGWRKRICCSEVPREHSSQIMYACPRTRLILRMLATSSCCFTPYTNELITDYMDMAVFPGEDYVLGEDNSFTTWLFTVPYDILLEYAAGVSGQDKEDIILEKYDADGSACTRRSLISLIMRH